MGSVPDFCQNGVCPRGSATAVRDQALGRGWLAEPSAGGVSQIPSKRSATVYIQRRIRRARRSTLFGWRTGS
jgi:hypothetical protein